MRVVKPMLFATFAVLFGLTACTDKAATNDASPPPTASSTSQMPPQLDASPAVPTDNAELSLDPLLMTTCGAAEVQVKWDVRTKHPDVSEIEIWVGSNDSNTKLWMANAPYGEAKTGPWTGPGALFILKNKADGAELDRVTMQGPPCPASE